MSELKKGTKVMYENGLGTIVGIEEHFFENRRESATIYALCITDEPEFGNRMFILEEVLWVVEEEGEV